jgi:hypothetical protein
MRRRSFAAHPPTARRSSVPWRVSIAACLAIAAVTVTLNERNGAPPPAAGERGAHQGTTTRAPSRLALLVGIDNYPARADGLGPAPLSGCANDAALVKRLLTSRYGFAESDIVTLTGKEATHATILRALHEHLVLRAGPETKVVFWFSGHGSEIPDISGSDRAPTDYEPSKDQTLLAFDSRLEGRNGGYDFTDDALHSMLAAIAAKDVLMVTDCCHSGGMTRGATQPIARSASEGVEPRNDEALRTELGWPDAIRLVDDDDLGARADHVVHISACAASEEAGETRTIEGWHGTLTWHLVQTLQEANEHSPWRVIVETVRARIAGREGTRSRQFVDVHGDGSRAPLGGIANPVPPGFLVEPLGNGDFRIHGGSLQGIGAETTLEVRDEHSRLLARCTPIGITSTRTDFRPAAALPTDRSAWVLPVGKLDGRAPLRVHATCDEAIGCLSGSELATLCSMDTADYVLQCVEDRLLLRTASGQGLSAATAPDDIAGLLFRESNFRTLWDAASTPGIWRLELGAAAVAADEPRIVHRGHDRPWAQIERSRGAKVLSVRAEPLDQGGSGLRLRVRNHSDTELHVAVFSVQEDRAITLLYGQDANNEVRAGKPLTLDVIVGSSARWAESRPMIDRYVAFGTSRWVDFRSLEQTAPVSTRGARAVAPNLRGLLLDPATSRPSENLRQIGVDVLDLEILAAPTAK